MTLAARDYSFFGVSSTYTPSGGSGSTVTIIISEEMDREAMGQSRRHTATVHARISDIAARPTPGATFAITDGEGNTQTWRVVADGVKELPTFKDFSGEWVCECERGLRPVI